MFKDPGPPTSRRKPSGPPTSGPTSFYREEPIAHTSDYEVSVKKQPPWSLVYLRGRCADSILEVLRSQVFKEEDVSFAIDMSKLSNISMLLAREVYFFSQRLKSGERRLVLVNPPEKLRSLLGLIAPTAKMISFSAEDELPPDVRGIETVSQRMEAEYAELRRNISTNSLWQFLDRESCWLCPFCGEILEDVRIASRVSVPQPVIEKIYRHIHHACAVYSPATMKYQSVEALERKVRSVNEVKFSASRVHAENLESKVKQLASKAQLADSLEQGLKVAVDRQRRLLPARAPEVPGCEIALTYRPAQRVSGDFYDFIEMPRGRLGISIGDVAGHGIEAGILMGMTKKVINIRAGELDDPVAALRKANADIYRELDRQTFVTAFLGTYDPETKVLSYARAGHNPPVLFNKGRKPRSKQLEAPGLMLGMSQGPIFERALRGEEVKLQSGDVLLLYTDGLEEAKDEKEEAFGLQRVIPIIESECDKPASYILGSIFLALDQFCGKLPQEDDITAICVKIL